MHSNVALKSKKSGNPAWKSKNCSHDRSLGEFHYFRLILLCQITPKPFPSGGRLFGTESPLMPLMNNFSQLFGRKLPSRQHILALIMLTFLRYCDLIAAIRIAHPMFRQIQACINQTGHAVLAQAGKHAHLTVVHLAIRVADFRGINNLEVSLPCITKKTLYRQILALKVQGVK